jgi:hypothetical protein
MYNHHHFKGATQNVSCIFQGVFEGGLEILCAPQRHLGDLQRLILQGAVPKNVSYILVWSPLKSSLTGLVYILYIYNYI